MNPIIPISLKRLATRQLTEVQAGRLSYDEAIQAIQKARLSREQIVEQLTRQYDPETVEAFQFFNLL